MASAIYPREWGTMSHSHPAEQAVRAFWEARSRAAAKQAAAGKADAGLRGAVTAGGHLAALEDIVVGEFVAAGLGHDAVRRKTGIELPGYYRPTKKWDIVVIDENHLVAAIEFKSQVGPSFGNNFNNRVEEAIGSAVDVWRAYEEGTFGPARPWLGYFFLLEKAPASTKAVSTPMTAFPVEPIFRDTSYMDRYQILCRRLLRERLYDAACFLTSSATPQPTISEPDEELTFATFAAKIAGRAAEIQATKAIKRLHL
jgi:restriction endonuclease XhoI-like protein